MVLRARIIRALLEEPRLSAGAVARVERVIAHVIAHVDVGPVWVRRFNRRHRPQERQARGRARATHA